MTVSQYNPSIFVRLWLTSPSSGDQRILPLRLSGEDWKRPSVCSADQPYSVIAPFPSSSIVLPIGRLGRLEQFRRQIRVFLPRHQLRVVPGFRHLGEQFILLRLLQKLGGVPQAGLAAGRQEGLVSDKLCLTPGPLFLGKLTGKLIDLSQAPSSRASSMVSRRGDEALCAVKRALLCGNGLHRFHRLPDALVYRWEVQDSGLIIVVLWVVEETLADLQHHWAPDR